MLFVRDPSSTAIINKSRKIPSTNSNSECLKIADERVPAEALQLFQFSAREPNKADPAPTRDIEAGTLIALFGKLDFPIHSVLFARQSPRVEVSRLLGHPGDSDERPIFCITGSRLCLVWSHDMRSRSSRGLLVNFLPDEYRIGVDFPKVLEDLLQPYRAHFGHPMLLAVVLAQFVQADTMAPYAPDSQTLRQIEHRLTVKSASRIDTMQRLRDLGRMTVKDRFILSALMKAMDLCRQVDEYYLHENTSNDARQLSNAFQWHVRQRTDLLDLDVQFLESISASVANQQASISTIINMQDGASMKTIAIITMLFLPATFVASFFAMPMFQLDDDSGQIVSRGSWIYWAFALPLTLAILLVWLGWWNWQNMRKQHDSPLSTPLTDVWAWIRGMFGTSTDPASYPTLRPIDKLGPLRSDCMRQFEDNFYDFEHKGSLERARNLRIIQG
ncbi:MAG: hypothetical protein Q9227_003265 [Pyrenula ochraceoflavens]